jgi:hypothetical protein
MPHGTKPRHWLTALATLALLLAFGWLVMTHVANVATDAANDAATKAIETHEDAAHE